MNLWYLPLIAFCYIALLFIIAIYADKNPRQKWANWKNASIYSLSIAVYCTSWTYYGAVGNSTSQGMDFFAIYLGPILVYLFGYPILVKIIQVSKKQNSSSIADFLASRYGKRQGVAVIVAIICTIAVVPYIALQLKAVNNTIELLMPNLQENSSGTDNLSIAIAFFMIFFAMVFGTRQVDVTQHHRGLMTAIAFESVVKLVALLCIALFAIYVFFGGPAEFFASMQQSNVIKAAYNYQGISASFITQTILAGAAIICLPRQFHVAVVENTNIKHLATARWMLPFYLFVISLLVVPIAATGLQFFDLTNINADMLVLHLPLSQGSELFAIVAFIGGFSAATAMVVVATLSLGTMLSNDVVLPIVMRSRHPQINHRTDLTHLLIIIRRLAIAIIIFAALGYQRYFAETEALTTIGLLAFSLVVQLMPALIGGLYWKTGNAKGAYAGLIIGSFCWGWTLMVPTLVGANMLSEQVMAMGLFGASWLKPESMLGFVFPDNLSHGVFISLTLNCLAYILVSKLSSTRLVDRIQASAFVEETELKPLQKKQFSEIKIDDLLNLLERFTGPVKAKETLKHLEKNSDTPLNLNNKPTSEMINYVERNLAGIIGTGSARTMIKNLLSGRQFDFEEVVTLFDDTSQAIEFNEELLFTTFDNLEQGVSVIDKNLQFVAWNKSYLQMFDYPEDFIHVGQPIEEIVRYNAKRGECGPGEIEEHVRKRLERVQKRKPHRFVRVRKSGMVVEMIGNPLPGGGFVTTFNNITQFVENQNELQEGKQLLEERVKQRTEQIATINTDLINEIKERNKAEELMRMAKIEAEQANASKTKFLALASHDILQPLNAARLFAASLKEDYQDPTLDKLDQALVSTEHLMATLLEIAKLDEGVLKPNIEPLAIDSLLSPLVDEFSLAAKDKGLTLRYVKTKLWVNSDIVYLRRILQNLISNAVKYSNQGKILIGAKRYQNRIKVIVGDQGVGISDFEQDKIFNDFYRISGTALKVQGVGLGLGVVKRMCQMLEHNLTLQSKENQGSLFSLTIPLATAGSIVQNNIQTTKHSVNAVRVLCVDNEIQNNEAMISLLEKWGYKVSFALTPDEAAEQPAPELLLMDFNLNAQVNGLELIEILHKQWQVECPTVLVTAHPDLELREKARALGALYLKKPIKPAALRSVLTKALN